MHGFYQGGLNGAHYSQGNSYKLAAVTGTILVDILMVIF